jgi:endonuclease/exonuclease/phosphatase family metal-dependent hydrolase
MWNIGIVSYNVNLSVSFPLRFNSAYARAERCADALYFSKAFDSYQIICFQELVVGRNTVLRSLIHHPHHTSKITTSWSGTNIKALESGLTIASTFPIVEQRHHVFVGSSYHLECFMAKSVLYAKIQTSHHNKHVHVFTTHTQAWSNEKTSSIRESQMFQAKIFLHSLHIPPDEPVLFTGDFNVDFYESYKEYKTLATMMYMEICRPEDTIFSFDPSTNTTVGNDDEDGYILQATQKGCYEDLIQTGVCTCCPRQLLDGIWFSRAHLSPTHTPSLILIKVKTPTKFQAYLNASCKRLTSDVSDHYPVFAQFTFPTTSSSFSLVPPPLMTYDDGTFASWKVILFQLLILVLLYVLILLCYHWLKRFKVSWFEIVSLFHTK